MNFLAIDTSTDICSISLCINNKIIDTNHELVNSSHTKLLATNVDLMIKNNNISLDILDYLVLAIGPGSYSGLRVGSSFMKGLAYVIQKNIIPINTIESMNSTLDIKGNYYVAIFSHRDYVFYQEFSDGTPIGKQGCDCITNLKDIDFYGYGLNRISNINYTEVLTSSLNLVDYLLKNHDLLVEEKKHISEISPIYLTKNN